MTVDTTKLAPWSADTETLRAQTMGHLSTATLVMPDGERFDLDLKDGAVTFDEGRSPRVEASLSCRAPTDQALLDRLDPRTGARVVIGAGYARPDGLDDVQPLADLGLRTRTVSRPDDLMALTAASDEALLIDGAVTLSGNVTNATTTGAITTIINQVLTTTPVVTGPAGAAVSALLFEDRWDAINDLADRIGAQVYDNGLRTWYIAPMPVVTTPALSMSVGAGGTVITSGTALARDDGFANYVVLVYKWTDTSDVNHVIRSQRRVTTGPYAAVTGNLRMLRFDRDVATTQAAADAAAASLVTRTVTRGRSFDLSAISAYWLRPGMTATVQLPVGGPENHLVVSVRFDLRDGTMQVTTRLPDGNYTIGA